MAILYKLIFLLLFIVLTISIGIIWDDKRLSRKIILGLSFSLLILILDGFFLALFRQFYLTNILISILIENVILLIYLLKQNKIDSVKINFDFPLIIIVIIGVALLPLFPSTSIYGGRDEGLYFMEGIHIADEGRLDFERDHYMVENYDNISGWCELGYLGVYSKYYYGTSESYGDYEFQFMPLFPIALAIGYLTGGLGLLIRVNSIIGIMSLLIIYCFIDDYIGNKYHSVLSCILILISPAFLWNARGTFSETLAQFIMFVAFYLLCRAWDRLNKNDWIVSAILIGITFLVRIDAFVCGIGYLIAMILMECWDFKKIKYYFYAISVYFVTAIFCILYGFFTHIPIFITTENF